MAAEADCMGLGDNAGDDPVTSDDLQGDILTDPNEPF
jgi:hypothetical protein